VTCAVILTRPPRPRGGASFSAASTDYINGPSKLAGYSCPLWMWMLAALRLAIDAWPVVVFAVAALPRHADIRRFTGGDGEHLTTPSKLARFLPAVYSLKEQPGSVQTCSRLCSFQTGLCLL
jgi:hypothetical protein